MERRPLAAVGILGLSAVVGFVVAGCALNLARTASDAARATAPL